MNEKSNLRVRVICHILYLLTFLLGMQGKAQGRLYIDDGQSLEYQKGSYITLELNMEGHTLSSKYFKSHISLFTNKSLLFGLSLTELQIKVLLKPLNQLIKS